MSDGNELIYSFGDLMKGVGGIAWELGAAAGGLAFRDGAITESDPTPADTNWSLEERFDTDPTAGAGTFRHLAIEVPDRGTLVCTSRGEPGLAGHGAEEATGRLEGVTRISFEETLISTEYDAKGAPARFGLELWPGEAEPANRAGAMRTSGALIAGGAVGEIWAGFFRCHTDGTEGLGTYLLWRA
jgi:hypothetical protein